MIHPKICERRAVKGITGRGKKTLPQMAALAEQVSPFPVIESTLFYQAEALRRSI